MNTDWSKFPKDDFEAARIFAVDYYRQFTRIKCPALKDEYVYFNHQGMGHILHKSNRTREEVVRRLAYLQYVEMIIGDPSVEVEYRESLDKEYQRENGNQVLNTVKARYWTLLKKFDQSLTIKLVIRQVDDGRKYFFSIMKKRLW